MALSINKSKEAINIAFPEKVTEATLDDIYKKLNDYSFAKKLKAGGILKIQFNLKNIDEIDFFRRTNDQLTRLIIFQ